MMDGQFAVAFAHSGCPPFRWSSIQANQKNVSFSVNSADFCQLMCQSLSTYLAI
jgi:hypothetical protein